MKGVTLMQEFNDDQNPLLVDVGVIVVSVGGVVVLVGWVSAV